MQGSNTVTTFQGNFKAGLVVTADTFPATLDRAYIVSDCFSPRNCLVDVPRTVIALAELQEAAASSTSHDDACIIARVNRRAVVHMGPGASWSAPGKGRAALPHGSEGRCEHREATNCSKDTAKTRPSPFKLPTDLEAAAVQPGIQRPEGLARLKSRSEQVNSLVSHQRTQKIADL